MKINKMTRRAFLQGSGGAMLAIPFLPSLLKVSVAEAQALSAPPLRFVAYLDRFGRDISKWYPATLPTTQAPEGYYYSSLGTSASGPISPILGTDFDPVRSKISLLRGLDCMQSAADGHSPGVCLTASGWVNGQLGFGYSMDAILEESSTFYPVAPMVGALRVSLESGGYDFTSSFTSRSGTLVWIPYEKRIMDVYNKYFNPTAISQAKASATRQLSISNLVMDDYRAAMSSRRISSLDKYKLDSFMQLLNQAELKLAASGQTCSANQPLATYTDSMLYDQAVMDLEVAALACGITKVVVHTSIHNDAGIVPSDEASHSCAHNGSFNGIFQWQQNKWSMSRAADLLKKLDSVTESNGTLLDNTIFYYGNIESRGFHNMNDMPIIIGGGKGVLKTGNYVDYRPRPNKVINGDIIAGRPINNLCIALFKALGIGPSEYQKFGQVGFGVYDQFDKVKLSTHYAPFLGSNMVNPLPGVLAA